MTAILSPFSLADTSGEDFTFPTAEEKPALLCFVKEDCPTCNLVMPLLQALHEGGHVDVLVPGQTASGNRALRDRHNLTLPLLDDSVLKVSFAYDVETVPLLLLANKEGRELHRLVGFDLAQWQAFWTRYAPNAAVDWKALPKWPPGCGSLTQDPAIAERLRAETTNSPLRARKVEIAPADDVHEFLFDQGFTNGLPVAPSAPPCGARRDGAHALGVQLPSGVPLPKPHRRLEGTAAGLAYALRECRRSWRETSPSADGGRWSRRVCAARVSSSAQVSSTGDGVRPDPSLRVLPMSGR